jgi:hypothetical protein
LITAIDETKGYGVRITAISENTIIPQNIPTVKI